LKTRWVVLFLAGSSILSLGCFGRGVQRDLILSREYQPNLFLRVAVIDLDPQIQFSEYVEAELLRKGHQVREGFTVRQVLKMETLKDKSLDPGSLEKIGNLLDVQGIVLCSVLEFSRFRDAYRLSIKMVNPKSGFTMWSAQGSIEGKKGQKTADLLREIVTSSLKDLPSIP